MNGFLEELGAIFMLHVMLIFNFQRLDKVLDFFCNLGGSIFGFLNISVMTFRALEKSIVIKKPFSALKKDKRFTLSNNIILIMKN
jgi:hypothetical protein